MVAFVRYIFILVRSELHTSTFCDISAELSVRSVLLRACPVNCVPKGTNSTDLSGSSPLRVLPSSRIIMYCILRCEVFFEYF